MIDCTCPEAAALETIPYNPCVSKIGKIGRMVFQRTDDANNTFVDGVNDISEEASWAPLPDAADSTKVVVTPVLEDVIFNEPDIRTDSENLDGFEIAVASDGSLVTAMFRNPTKEQIAALRALKCERELSVYFIGASNKIGARSVNTTDHAGIKISPDTFIMRDPSKAGTKADEFKAMIQFGLPEGWFDSFDIVTPEDGFTPIDEIRPS